uniref:Uncharacterized protein n=1 Tax=Knipowitschia caucasica TaxID=637954 RepID=A0AAV2KPY9_KNICA
MSWTTPLPTQLIWTRLWMRICRRQEEGKSQQKANVFFRSADLPLFLLVHKFVHSLASIQLSSSDKSDDFKNR